MNRRIALVKLQKSLKEAQGFAAIASQETKDPFEGTLLHGVWSVIQAQQTTVKDYIEYDDARERGEV